MKRSYDLYMGVFAEEEDILSATRASRDAGLAIHDVYTPYAVHHLDEAMGLRPCRLTGSERRPGFAGRSDCGEWGNTCTFSMMVISR